MKMVLKGGFRFEETNTQIRIYLKSRCLAWVNKVNKEVGVFGKARSLLVSSGSYIRKCDHLDEKTTAIETYFQDWTHPTEQESEMFFMLFGVEIPWISIELEEE